MQYKNSYTNCRLDAFFLCPKREGHMSGSTPSRSSSRASLWHRLKSMQFSEVPREIAICEFDCPRNQCTHGEWATCQRRIQLEALCHPKQADGAPGASCPNPSIQIDKAFRIATPMRKASWTKRFAEGWGERRGANADGGSGGEGWREWAGGVSEKSLPMRAALEKPRSLWLED